MVHVLFVFNNEIKWKCRKKKRMHSRQIFTKKNGCKNEDRILTLSHAACRILHLILAQTCTQESRDFLLSSNKTSKMKIDCGKYGEERWRKRTRAIRNGSRSRRGRQNSYLAVRINWCWQGWWGKNRLCDFSLNYLIGHVCALVWWAKNTSCHLCSWVCVCMCVSAAFYGSNKHTHMQTPSHTHFELINLSRLACHI